MSIYYTNTNNREIFCHSITANVINGVTGSPAPVPGPTGATGPTGPLPVTPLLTSGITGLGFTGISGIFSVSGVTGIYSQVGNVVNGSLAIANGGWPANGVNSVLINLPVPLVTSNFTQTWQCNGSVASGVISMGGSIVPNVGSNNMKYQFDSATGITGTSDPLTGIFSYIVNPT